MNKLVWLLALCTPCAAWAQPNDDVEPGRQLFMSNGCYSCHGTAGQGGERAGAPRIAPDPHPFDAFVMMVRNPREAMPRFDARFVSDEQLRAIHRYLAAVPKNPSAKDISGPARASLSPARHQTAGIKRSA